MQTTDCVFCKIIAGHIPTTVVASNDQVLVIKDLNPKAPIHYLILPKEHIINVSHITKQNAHIGSELLLMAQQLSASLDSDKAFRLVMNNGTNAGQSVFHMHMHFLAGGFMPGMTSDVL